MFIKTGRFIKLSTITYQNFYLAHREPLDFTCGLFATAMAKVTVSAVTTVIFRASYTADRSRLSSFVSSLYSGQVESKTDDAVRVLRNHLLFTSHSGAAVRTDTYFRVESALIAYLQHRPIAKLYAASAEQFPIPEETE